jgi:hypothetical protein
MNASAGVANVNGFIEGVGNGPRTCAALAESSRHPGNAP